MLLIRCAKTVLVVHCTFMAGLAETCSHVGAILHWVKTELKVCESTTMHFQRQHMAHANIHSKYSLLVTQCD